MEFPAEMTDASDDPTYTIYLEACTECKIIPASYFLRHLNNANLDMRHHGLGAEGMKPLATALVVSWCSRCVNLNNCNS